MIATQRNLGCSSRRRASRWLAEEEMAMVKWGFKESLLTSSAEKSFLGRRRHRLLRCGCVAVFSSIQLDHNPIGVIQIVRVYSHELDGV